MSHSILVLGAGELGTPVLYSLAQHKYHPQLTVLLRPSSISTTNGEKKDAITHLQSLNISLLAGDIASSSPSELSTLFKPFDCIIGCTGFSAGAGSQLKIARAVLSAGVHRYIPWQFGVDYDVIGRGSAQELLDEQLDVRDLLRSQRATEWVIVSTGLFTSFLFEPAFGVVNAEKTVVRALGGWENRVTVTAPEDIGRLTAEVVLAVPRIVDDVVYTAGDTVTYRELADIVDLMLGRKVKREDWSLSALRKELVEEPDDIFKKYRVVFGEGKGVAWDVSKSFNHQKDIRVQSVDEWARSNLDTKQVQS